MDSIRSSVTSWPALLRPLLAGLALVALATPGQAAGPQMADGTGEGAPVRYSAVLGADPAAIGFQRHVGAAVVTFDGAETDALVAAGWQVSAPADGFASLGERVTTFVAIAEALGLDPAVGALQANLGTPQENGIGDLADAVAEARYALDVAGYDIAELERHRADALSVLEGMRASPQAPAEGEDPSRTVAALEAEIATVDARLAEIRGQAAAEADALARLEAELALALGEADTGSEPPGWATANLDVTGDGIVDRADLDAATAGQQPTEDGGIVAQ